MKKTQGLTLLELTIVTAVLMVVLGVVLIGSRGNSNDYRALRNAAVTLQADIRYAQRRAVMEGRRIGVHFEPTHNRYNIIAPESYPMILRTVYVPNGVNFLSTNHAQNRIVFLPRGTSTAAGTIVLTNGRYWQQMTTTVGAGRVRIADIISN